MIRNKRKSPETDLQIAIVEWFNLAYPDHARWLHHSPNGGKRSISEAVRFKKMGVKAGFPDLVLYYCARFNEVYPYCALAMELKRKGQKPTSDQLAWLNYLETQKFYVKWVDDFDYAVRVFNNYMYPIKPRVKA